MQTSDITRAERELEDRKRAAIDSIGHATSFLDLKARLEQQRSLVMTHLTGPSHGYTEGRVRTPYDGRPK